jgi:predicted metal-binding membrane protein
MSKVYISKNIKFIKSKENHMSSQESLSNIQKNTVIAGIIAISFASWYFLFAMDANMKSMNMDMSGMNMEMKSKSEIKMGMSASEIKISRSVVRLVPPNLGMTAGYITLENLSDKDLTLVGASSDDYNSIEIHETVIDNDKAMMKQVESFEIKSKSKAELKPLGHHLMLMGPLKVFKEDDNLIINLHFASGKEMSVDFTVKRNVMDMDMDVDMDHGDMGMMDVDTWLPNTWWMPPMHNVWNSNDFYQLVVMWIIMMVAMMSPSIIPTVLMFATVNKSKRKNNLQYTPTYIFYFGYLIAWVLFSIGISVIQYPLHQVSLINPMMASINNYLSGFVLILAGIYQLTPYKNACLDKCRSPLSLVMSNWKDGNIGALRMGLGHGFYCVFCCWFLMAILLVAGVMNLYFVVGLTIFVLLEKLILTPKSFENTFQKLITVVPGIALIIGGIYFLFI